MKPIYGYGFFNLSSHGILTNIIIFEYLDEELEYYYLSRNSQKRKAEIALLTKNMQSFLDEEKLVINGHRCLPHVEYVEIGFASSKDRPFIKFVVRSKCEVRRGLNIYEDIYSPERAEYSYNVTWVFPPGSEIIDVDMGVESLVISSNILSFTVKKGELLKGAERIVFSLP